MNGQASPSSVGSLIGAVGPTRLVGREHALAELIDLCDDPETRLVTILGAGGVGKSRLAQELIARAQGPAWFVELAEVRDASTVLETAAAPCVPQSGKAADRIIRSLGRTGIVVLDNLEHVIDAAVAIGDLAARLQPGATIVATSRTALDLRSERVLILDALTPAAAVELFDLVAVRSGGSTGTDDVTVIVEIVERLDRLPLAIELAASLLPLVRARPLLRRLDHALTLLVDGPRDAPERQRSLRSTLTWSHNLLELSEQRLFRRLALFPSGCTVDAAETVASVPGEHPVEIVGLARSLLRKSLIQIVDTGTGSARLKMLETTHQFAYELLGQDPRLFEARTAASAWLLALVSSADRELVGPGQAEWLDTLADESGNVRTVVAHAVGTGTAPELSTALRLAARYWRVWAQRGSLTEGAGLLDELLSVGANCDGVDAEALAEAATAAGLLAIRRSDYAGALRHLSEARRRWEHLGGGRGLATTLDGLGWVAGGQGRFDDAQVLLEHSIALMRNDSDHAGSASDPALADPLARLGMVLVFASPDASAAVPLLEESLAIKRRIGDQWGIAFVLVNLASADIACGKPHHAFNHLSEAMDHALSLGDDLLAAYVVEVFALAVGAEPGRSHDAATLLGLAEKLRATLGAPAPPRLGQWLAELRRRLSKTIGDTAFKRAWTAGNSLTPDEATAFAVGASRGSSVLSKREVEVLAVCSEGLSDAEIAKRLFVSVRTVNAHLRSANTKLATTSRMAAVKAAREAGLIG